MKIGLVFKTKNQAKQYTIMNVLQEKFIDLTAKVVSLAVENNFLKRENKSLTEANETLREVIKHLNSK